MSKSKNAPEVSDELPAETAADVEAYLFPLSFAQQRLWFLHQLAPHSHQYNLTGVLLLSGPLKVEALADSFNEIVRRHETLRTAFALVDGEPMQVIAPHAAVELEVVRMEGSGGRGVDDAAVGRWIAEASRRPFVLSQAPLLRVALLRLDADEHLLLVTMHHLVSDAWSIAVLVRELTALYAAFSSSEPSPLPELPVQYADFTLWQKEWVESGAPAESLAYWRRQLSGRLPTLSLHADRPRPAVQTFEGARLNFELTKEIVTELGDLGRREGATLSMTFLTAFLVLLHRYTGEEDLLVGLPVANRQRTDIENLIGFFVNLLPLRADLSGSPSFAGLLRRVKQLSLEAYEHQSLPVEKLIEDLPAGRSPGRAQLFQVVFDLHEALTEELRLPDIGVRRLEVDNGTAKFDLALSLERRADGVGGYFEYSTDVFEREGVERMHAHWRTLLASVLRDPALPISQLPLLTDSERRQLLVEWNETARPVPAGALVPQLFEETARRHPDRAALVWGAQTVTYGQLREMASKVARRLRRSGVGAEALVGVMLGRGPELVAALLGVLKAGAAYLPLDEQYPAERIEYMLRDGGVRVLICEEEAAASWRGKVREVLTPAEAAEESAVEAEGQTTEGEVERIEGERLAYVIYTSGSTGRPKGVAVQHASLANLVRWHQQTYEVGPADRATLLAGLSFDAAVWELWPYLTAGASLYIPAEEETRISPAHLKRWLVENEINVSFVTTPLAEQLIAGEWPAAGNSLRALLTGGDRLTRHPSPGFSVPVFNHYGPTESTVVATAGPVPLAGAEEGLPSIGRPIANTRIYILDRSMNPAPVGVTGELYVGGAGLARGYWHRPGLTAASFVPDPFSGEAGARLYRTGDMARYRRDGELEYAGRGDRQVKVRGHRVELGEVERVLGEREGVRAAAVVARREEAGGVRLVAYVVREAGAEAGAATWEEYARLRLPEAMRPWVVRELEEMPLTANGKVDREELERRALAEQRVDGAAGVVAARDEVEGLLARVWEEVLGATGVGVHDNFFDLGGDSILSIQIVAKVNQAGLSLKPRDLFEHQTIAELAGVAQTFAAVEATQGDVTGEVPLTPIQHWFFEQSLAEPSHWNQSVMLEVRRRLDPKPLAEAVVTLCRQHDALRLRFTRGEDGWRQSNEGWSEESAREVFSLEDVSGLAREAQTAEIERRAAEAQGGLNLERGPLWRVLLFDCGPERPQRLLLLVHHLAVDGVSWRILLEDLKKGYEDLERGGAASLGRKTTSFKRWAEELRRHAQAPECEEELAYWQNCLEPEGSAPAADFDERDNSEQGAQTFELYLAKDDTHDLLHRVQSAARANVNELLLAALAQAWGAWGRGEGLRLMVEGHGREYLAEALDVSRTVGWFTKIFPVRLETAEIDGPEQSVRLVQETLQSIPREGLGFGLLRYMNQAGRDSLRGLSLPAVSFNYLGQFDHLLPDDGWFALARESAGPMHDPHGARPYKLEIGGGVAGGVLQLICRYHEKMYRRESIEALAQQWLAALRRLIAHYCELEASDLPLEELADEHLSSAELDNILTQLSDA